MDYSPLTSAVRLMHADCLEAMRALASEGARIDAVVTDPPYCSGGATEATRGAATHQGLRSETVRSGRFSWFESDNMTTAGLCWLLREMAVAAGDLLDPAGSLVVFCDWRMAFQVGPAMESAGFRLRNILVWDKGHFGCGTGFRPQHELALHLSRRAPKFHAADVGNVIGAKRLGRARTHPTEKPVLLLRDIVRVVCPPGGTVLDPFAGSGSTGAAAIEEGRNAILIERDPAHVATISERLRLGGSKPRDAQKLPPLLEAMAAE